MATPVELFTGFSSIPAPAEAGLGGLPLEFFNWTTTVAPATILPPVVSAFSPALNSNISASTQVSFAVTDPNGEGFVALLIIVEFGYAKEVAFDGSAFTTNYINSIQRIVSTTQRTYSLLRVGGWPSSPSVQVFAIDAGGNVNQ